jgi:hypothetical protein
MEKNNEVCKITVKEFEKCVYYISTRVFVSSVTVCHLLTFSFLMGISFTRYLPYHPSFGQ